MANTTYSISQKDLFDLFGRLAADHKVYVPYEKGEKLYFDEFDSENEASIELGGVRQSQPLKSFISHAREKVVNGSQTPGKGVVVAGVKACDLSSLDLQDFVFLQGEVADPFYQQKRSQTIIISCDCTYAIQTCFCQALDGAPYPSKNFDINLSPIDKHFFVEVGSDRGQAIVEKYKMFFQAPSGHSRDIRKSNRDRVIKQVEGYINAREVPAASEIKGTVKNNYNNTKLWEDTASTCVECGACNLVCPTCHCFLLYDEKDQAGPKRFKAWDACLYSTFAAVAGGHNPRKHLYERMRNRFDKKFAFFPEVMGTIACTGCGRCIEACAGDIDIREVLKGLVKGTWKKPPHD